DDVIATLAAVSGDRPVRILSTDRDYYQLIGPATLVVNPRGRPALVTEAALVSQFGVAARQWCDFRALAGDPSDGIPGLPGVGMTTAAALLRDGRSIEDLREYPEIAGRWDDVLRWRELIRLRTDVPLAFGCTGAPTAKLPSPS